MPGQVPLTSIAEYRRLIGQAPPQREAPPTRQRPASREIPAIAEVIHTALSELLSLIQDLADAHGWLGSHSWNPPGPGETNPGLHCLLVRDVILYAFVLDAHQPLTRSQQRWKDAWEATGQGEIYVWRALDRTAIIARLSQPDQRCTA